MRTRRLRAGTSLIEILTVIVVFLVGILAVIQIFPPGLRILRDTKNNTVAINLAQSEMQRLQGKANYLPEMIVPINFAVGSSFITPDPQVSPDMLDAFRVGGTGAISQAGQILVGGVPRGNWGRASGANRFSRVIGEGGPVSAPKAITPADSTSTVYGSLVDLMFAPMVYDIDASNSNLGKPGEVVVYGNNLTAKAGTENDPATLVPVPTESVDTSTFYYVPGNLTLQSPHFNNEDQIWIPAVQDAGAPVASSYRIRLTFLYQTAAGTKTVDAIVVTSKNDTGDYFSPSSTLNYSIISLKQLVALQGYFGTSGLTTANYLGVVPDSISVQRVYDELPPYQIFSATNPYQYEVISLNLGSIVVSPLAASYSVHDASGVSTPLFAKVDYTVYDWRILHDEFRAPDGDGGSVKLALNSIKALGGGLNPDGLLAKGIGGQGNGDYSIWTPDVTGNVGSQDFVLYDLDLGAIVIGNQTQEVNSHSAYSVDKSRGNVRFTSVAPTTPGMWAYVAFPKGDRTVDPATDPNDLWHIASAPVNVAGHTMRALYRANGEYAVQVLKAASSYRIAYPSSADQLQVGECFAGGTNSPANGSPTSLYFPVCDFGQKVVAGELHLSDGSVMKDQDLLIDHYDLVNGAPVDAYAVLPNGASFMTSDPYAVRWVRGASVKVRSLWNTETFALTSDTAQNYQNFIDWSHNWKKNNAESVETGGQP